MTRLSVLAAAGLCVAAGEGAVTRPLEVQGHRGARALRPENTLAGFDYALSVGVDTLELDLAVTRDDHLVVSHELVLDPRLCTEADGAPLAEPRPLRQLGLADLRRYDCGRLRHPGFPRQQPVPGAHIPSLSEVFALVKASPHSAARRVRLNLEPKSVPGSPELTPAPGPYAELLVLAIRAHGWVARSVVQCFDHRVLREVSARAPEVATSVLVNKTLPDLVLVARSVGAGIVSPHLSWVTAADVKRLHAAGLRVIPWTANEPPQWERLVRIGVDGIITDDPAGLIDWLRARQLRGR